MDTKSKSMKTGDGGNAGAQGESQAASQAAAQVQTAASSAPAGEVVTLSKADLNAMLADAATQAAAQAVAQFRAQAPAPTVVLQAKPHRDIGEETTKMLAAQSDALAIK